MSPIRRSARSRPHPWDAPVDIAPDADELGRPLGVAEHDPLAGTRGDGEPPLDVLCAGTVFYDLVFTGLASPPALGRELWTRGMGSSPGGIANLAVALRRLGVRTALAGCFADDLYGDFCWDTLCGQEGVDLSLSRRCPGWHSPVTVSLAYDRDRAMVTHGHAPPLTADQLVGEPPPARAAVVSLGESLDGWAAQAAEAGALLIADVGWDPSGSWSDTVLEQLPRCHAFLPNHAEAMLYTRTDSPQDALHRLAERVPVAVVTCGPRGAIGVDADTGEEVAVPAVPIEALDATGAGDVFTAGFTTGTLAGWSLRWRLAFAALVAGLSVRHFGGSLSAPGWADVDAWWQGTRTAARHGDWSARELADSYGFLDEVIPRPVTDGDAAAPRRATATLGFREPPA